MTQSAAGLSILSNTMEIGGSNVGPFGDLVAAPPTPVLQLDFTSGINIQTGVETEVNSATVDTSAGRLRLQSGTNAAGSAIFNSKRVARYRPGQGVTARFTTAFTTGVASSTQIVGMGNANDGYFVGFSGATFGILHRIGGSDAAFTAQTAWNGDKCAGAGSTGFTLDPTKGNVWMIRYPYLGYGSIKFYVLDPSGVWLLVHTIRYPNTTATVQLTNPNLFFYAQSLNTGAVTNQIVYVGSVGVFLVGQRSFIGNPRWSYTANKTTVTNEVVLANFRNATTYNTVTNRALMRLNSLTVASTANNGAATVRLYFGATIGGSPSWGTINGTTGDSGVTITSGNSVVSVDTAGTTSAGLMQFSSVLGSPGTEVIDLTPFDLFLGPAEILSVTGASTASTTIGLALNWTEDI